MNYPMGLSGFSEGFALYLWRSPESPGTLYLANGLSKAEALCRCLAEEGYIVKVLHAATDTEYELRDGALWPLPQAFSQALA
jgi:hypothetical protein